MKDFNCVRFHEWTNRRMNFDVVKFTENELKEAIDMMMRTKIIQDKRDAKKQSNEQWGIFEMQSDTEMN
uniref:SPK domain-containing protein n=1 Tax=Caenorhabditis tropicalis TaxID=1561998 RepID=A0A1I7TAZ5_9PELO